MRNAILRVLVITVTFGASALLSACGGGSGLTGSSSGGGSSGGGLSAGANSVVAVIDGGPNGNAPNTLYTSVQVCAHGSSTNCQIIDHIQVDTASYGFRVLAPVLTVSGLAPTTDPSGNAIIECTAFVDGYSWGPVTTVDLTVGGLTASNIPIQVIGDSASANMVPSSCSNGQTAENTVAAFGANGILGVGFFAEDCGSYCASGTTAPPGQYYACSNAGICNPTLVSKAQQVLNPVPLFGTNSNGVVIQVPQVYSPGASTATANVIFGIGTETNNQLTAAHLFGVYGSDCQVYSGCPGTFISTYAGTTEAGFLDSGSNAYFFEDSSINNCVAPNPGFYCPAASLALTATIQGVNAQPNAVNVNFTIDNALTLFSTGDFALPTLGGGSSSLGASFDWGMPFFYGKTMFFAMEGATVAGASSAGPWVGF